MSLCPCESSKKYNECCGPFINGENKASTAEELMRSRYTAFTQAEIDYIEKTYHPKRRNEFDKQETENWSKLSDWKGLEVIETHQGKKEDNEGMVEFVAKYSIEGKNYNHHEVASFEKVEGEWFFVDGKIVNEPVKREGPKIGRNDPCPCESGKKYKKCCGR